jgi:outer membrane protein assembly factor BamD (BamD/ComL family)
MIHKLLSKAFDKADQKLQKTNGNMATLPSAVRNFLIVYSAQGVIDNGGYRYFFESDWPNKPPYAIFVDAYKAIGCTTQAEDLQRVITTFPFENPHLHEAKRNKYIDDNYDEDTMSVRDWGNKLCGDKSIWEQLVKYYNEHKKDFA